MLLLVSSIFNFVIKTNSVKIGQKKDTKDIAKIDRVTKT